MTFYFGSLSYNIEIAGQLVYSGEIPLKPLKENTIQINTILFCKQDIQGEEFPSQEGCSLFPLTTTFISLSILSFPLRNIKIYYLFLSCLLKSFIINSLS